MAIRIQKQLIVSEDHEWGWGTIIQKRTVNGEVIDKQYTKINASVIPALDPEGVDSNIQAVLDLTITLIDGDARYARINGSSGHQFAVGIPTDDVHAVDFKTFTDGLDTKTDTSHLLDLANPHTVTKAQVGLNNAENTSDLNKPVSAPTQAALDGKVDIAHLTDFTNPHQVDSGDIGLDQVDNTSDLDKPISTATQTALDSKQGIFSYDYQKEGITSGGAITIVDDTYQTICELITPSRPAGTYELLASMVWTYDTASRSAFYRWSADGGSTWKELSTEASDKTNTENFSYSFPKELPEGVVHMVLQARKENAADEMIVDHANLVVERKG